MGTFHLATSRVSRNPVRCQQWNASIRGGDDFKLAMTVYQDDAGTPAQVSLSHSRLTLQSDIRWPAGMSGDYGWGWATGGSPIPFAAGGTALQQTDGFVTPVRDGGINFALPGTATQGMWGRYRLTIEVDMLDGDFSQVEGILQVRPSWNLPRIGHTPAPFFTLDQSQLDVGILAGNLVNGLPVDQDGFFLVAADFSGNTSSFNPRVLRGLAATGTMQGTALSLPAAANIFETVPAGSGAVLPLGPGPTTYRVVNAAGADLLVYPPSGAAIMGNAVNIPVVVGANQTVDFMTQDPATMWFAS